ncbi:MAG TPA: TlpA disulfide reductase family protein [Fimbriimonadaceae bacterium]|nr:TlpA disulfide reductase family protein [Fimbriimonadaceae bacterium]HRJ34044.1 TlpA disulfide reductase family protein [Fimbriimonadaceae bacterium]
MKLSTITIPTSLLLAGAGWLFVYSARNANQQIDTANQPWLKHPVTRKMNEDADAQKLKPLTEFQLKDVSGKVQTLQSLAPGKPAVIVLIKDQCPCNLDSQPLLNRLQTMHAPNAQFIGIINSGDSQVARSYAKVTSVNYPILLDPEVEVAKAHNAKRSVYLILVNASGRIVKIYPGYSDAILTELNSKLAQLTGQPEQPYDPGYAPKVPTSGCILF